ncbi:MAG: invasion associated locus B family protein [Pseudomonadota bacterium]
MINAHRNPLVFAAAALLSVGLAGPAAADETVKATHGAWEVRCNEADLCEMTQTYKNDEGVNLMRVSINKLSEARNVDGEEMVAVSRFHLAPVPVLIRSGVSVRIDEGDAFSTPFVVCGKQGCMTRSLMSQDFLQNFRDGATVELQALVETRDGPKALKAAISLTGFTDAYGEL